MSKLTISKLDKLKFTEDYIKQYVSETYPKFILRNIAMCIIDSDSVNSAHIKVKNYLTGIIKSKIIGNDKLMRSIQDVFNNPMTINDFYSATTNIDYHKLEHEKTLLLGENWNDEYERSNRNKRSLQKVLLSGISVVVDINKLKNASAGFLFDSPLSFCMKDVRALTINKFSGSKVSHFVHDVFDHMYFFYKLEYEGFFSESFEFRNLVGNPHRRDIFSRESELIASIAYERRYSLHYKDHFRLSLKNEYVRSFVCKYFTSVSEKKRYLKKIDFLTQKDISIYHIYYNILCELGEQIRKVGVIKLLNDKGGFQGVITNKLKSDYLKIIIDVLYIVGNNEESFKLALLQTYICLESIVDVCLNAEGEKYSMNVNISNLDSFNRKSIDVDTLKKFFNL